MQWSTRYGLTRQDRGESVLALPGGGYLVAGSTEGEQGIGQRGLIFALDERGGIRWQRVYSSGEVARGRGQHFLNCVVPAGDGGFLLAGEVSFSPGRQAWVLRIDTRGEPLWSQAYVGGFGGGRIKNIIPVREGYLLVGETSSFGWGGSDLWILRVDARGGVLWQKAFGTAGYDNVARISGGQEDGYLVAATVPGPNPAPTWQNTDLRVFKLDDQGDIVWQTALEAPGPDRVEDVIPARDGGALLAGSSTFSRSGSGSGWLLHLDRDGALKWQRHMATGNEVWKSLRSAGDGSFLLAGSTQYFTMKPDAVVSKVDQHGETSPQIMDQVPYFEPRAADLRGLDTQGQVSRVEVASAVASLQAEDYPVDVRPLVASALLLRAPRDGETLVSGEHCRLLWPVDLSKDRARAVVLFSTDDGREWTQIAFLQGNPGTYDWLVPVVERPAEHCKIRVNFVLPEQKWNEKAGGSIVSRGFFRIIPAISPKTPVPEPASPTSPRATVRPTPWLGGQ